MNKLFLSLFLAGSLIVLSGCSISFRHQDQKETELKEVSNNDVVVTSPNIATTSNEEGKGTGLTDDNDKDGLTDKQESYYKTDLNNFDTDGDGHSDGEEVQNGYDPLGPGKLQVAAANLSLDSLSVLGKFGSLEPVVIDLSKQMEEMLPEFSDKALISYAKGIRPDLSINDAKYARQVISDGYKVFPHGPEQKALGKEITDFAFNDISNLASRYIEKNKSDAAVVGLSKYLGMGFDGGFVLTPSEGVYKFRQIVFGSRKCTEIGMPSTNFGTIGIVDGLITSDDKLYFIGAGCLKDKESFGISSFDESSLVGYVWSQKSLTPKVEIKKEMQPLEGEAGERDKQRLQNVKLIQIYLEWFLNDHGRYPDMITIGKNLTEKGYNNYPPEIPAYPLPLDGSCQSPDSSYSYKVLSGGQDYSFETCIGGAVGNLKSGVHILNSKGFVK